MSCRFLLLPLLLCIFLPLTLNARTIYVHPDSSVSTIQEGINLADNGDIVMVLPGTYYENKIDFQGKAIVVTSTNPLDHAVVASTIVDANAQGSVFDFDNGEGPESILTGFTITGGHSSSGGGIFCGSFSSPTISYNVITGNTAGNKGGGIAGGLLCSPIIANNMITNNTILNWYGEGGGISLSTGANSIISNNVISSNSFSGEAGMGGGISSVEASLTINGCTITGNRAADYGGGLSCYGSDMVVSNTIFWDNEGTQGDEIMIWDYDNPATIAIDYSNVDGGQGSIFIGGGCFLYWGDGMVDTIPSFAGDGYHLNKDSPLRNIGNPEFTGQDQTDIDGESRVIEERVDIGVDEIRIIRIEDEGTPIIHTGKEALKLE
jgi:hypothetical protein